MIYCAPEAQNPNHYAYSNIRDAFVRLGIQLVDFDYLAEMAAHGREGMVRRLEALIEAEQPDIFYHAICEDEMPREFLLRLRDYSPVTTMVFFSDDDWRLEHSLKWVGLYNVATTNDMQALPVYEANGHSHVRHIQYACNERIYAPKPVAKRYDVTFVGQPYSGRPEMIRALLAAGVDVRVWGPGWEAFPDLRHIAGGVLPTGVMLETMCASRIVLGLAWCSWPPPGDGPKRPQLKGRTFETAACSVFQLTLDDPRLAHYFEVGTEIATFRDSDDLVEKIRYYLANETEREAIAAAGHRRAMADHTWERRWRPFFENLSAQPLPGKRPLALKPLPGVQESSEAPAPSVSVITYSYNGAEYLDAMISSVLAQSYRDFELIVLDDGSTDHTETVVARYLCDPRVRYFKQPNVGQTGRFDLIIACALKHARGELIAFLGADDLCMPNRLERQMAIFDADPDLDIVHTNGHHIDPQGRTFNIDFSLPLPYNAWTMTRVLMVRNLIAHPTVMMRRRCLVRVGPFEEGFAADYHYWLKSARFLKYRYLDEKLIAYRIHPKSASTTQTGMARSNQEAIRLVETMRKQLTIRDLYPEIDLCEDKQRAMAAAYVDFGNLLVFGMFKHLQLALNEYERALHHLSEPEPAILHNIAVVLMMAGGQDELVQNIVSQLVAIGFAPTLKILEAGPDAGGEALLLDARRLYPDLFEAMPAPGDTLWNHDGRQLGRVAATV